MPNEEQLNLLGRVIIEEVIDRSIKTFDDILSGNDKVKALIELHESLNVLNQNKQKLCSRNQKIW